MSEKLPIVKSKDNTLYLYKGEVEGKFEFENLSTGVSGLITADQATKVYGFTIPYTLNLIAAEHPQIIYLLKHLNLKLQNGN